MWKWKDKFELKLKNKDEVIKCIASGFGSDFISVKFNNSNHRIYYKDIEYLKREDGEYKYYDLNGNVTDTNVEKCVDIDPYGMCIYDVEYR